jgi:hypothetical protein
MTTATINEDPSSPAYASAMNNITKGSTLLDGLSDRFNRAEGINAPALASLVSPFPEFEPPVYAQAGGLGGDLAMSRPMFMHGGIHEGGGKVSGPGGEKDDMINAKLSNNEFVMTADAVRGAGNGDINKGANKMYQLMNNFERMA